LRRPAECSKAVTLAWLMPSRAAIAAVGSPAARNATTAALYDG
jgi:hypothetical protein